MLIHETKDARYWSGVSRQITEKEGIPPRWFPGAIPELSDGEYAIWLGNIWGKTDVPPRGIEKYPSVESAHTAMVAFVNEFTRQITAKYPEAEVISWPAKAEAARSVIAGSARADQEAMVQQEADLTGRTLSDQAAAIVAKAVSFEAIISKTSGLRQATDAALEGTATSAERETVLSAAKAQAETLAAAYGLA